MLVAACSSRRHPVTGGHPGRLRTGRHCGRHGRPDGDADPRHAHRLAHERFPERQQRRPARHRLPDGPPGWKVNYQVQQWNGIVDKLTTALASNNPPDVVEMGNTQAITFEAAGALMDLTSSRAALNGGTSNDSASADQAFLASLNSASVYQDKLFAMPFYAGDRVLIYRKDLLSAAGIDPTTITSKDKLIAAAKTLQTKNASVKDFSGLYVAGQNWYSLLQMIWDRGGALATNSGGKWTASLSRANPWRASRTTSTITRPARPDPRTATK